MAWLLLVFAVLYFGIVKATLPRLGRAMDEREQRMTGDIDTAAAAKAEADQIQAAYEAEIAKAQADARAQLAQRRADATKSIEARLAAANAAIQAKADSAEAALSDARTKAAREVEIVAADAACDIVEKLTGLRPAPADAERAAQAALG